MKDKARAAVTAVPAQAVAVPPKWQLAATRALILPKPGRRRRLGLPFTIEAIVLNRAPVESICVLRLG